MFELMGHAWVFPAMYPNSVVDWGWGLCRPPHIGAFPSGAREAAVPGWSVWRSVTPPKGTPQ